VYPYNYQMTLDWKNRLFYLYNINVTNYVTALMGFHMESLEVISTPSAEMVLDWMTYVDSDE
jgi:hypothetical protein